MTERQAFIAFFIGILLVEAVVLGGLALLGASSEALASAYVLLLSAVGLSGGLIFMRYH